jgi:hypothetical protein
MNGKGLDEASVALLVALFVVFVRVVARWEV